IVIGALLHANSENMIMLWVVQNLAVPLHSYGAHGVANWLGELVGFPVEYVEVTNLGMELNPPDGRELLSSHGIGVLLMIVPWIMASALGVRPTRRDTFAWLCAFMTFAMFLANERFAEYFFPFAALAGGGMISRALISEPVRDARQRSPMATRFAVATVVLLVVVNVVARPVSLHNMISGRERGQYAGLGDAINKHVPKGEAVFHPDWHVFTMLLFYAPEHDYVVGLDPTFLALRSPLHFRAYMGMRSGEEKPGGLSQTYDEIIHGLFDMEWVSVVPANHDAFAKIFQRIELKKHAVLVEADKNDKWRLYKLAPRPDKPASR
ncbi:MAG: hypothetical protein L6Q71_06455, partial [Planctomycetes bacterium]|nr:hypothetical protein [Planctomycetota bacterium]